MKLLLAKVAFYAGSGLVGLGGAVFFLVALMADPEHLAPGSALWMLGGGAVGVAGEALRQWSRGYYFPCR